LFIPDPSDFENCSFVHTNITYFSEDSVCPKYLILVSLIELSPAIEFQVPPPLVREGEMVLASTGGEFMRISKPGILSGLQIPEFSPDSLNSKDLSKILPGNHESPPKSGKG